MAGFLIWYGYDLPNTAGMTTLTRRASVIVLDRNRNVLATYGDLYGKAVRAKDLPPHVINALLAIEDRRFYSHFGVDIFGLFRAAWANYRAGGVVQGGSTITQQLAKNFLQAHKLYRPQDRSFRRKIQEAIMACWLEYAFTKEQILTMYLNRVYFGGGTYGIDGAARRYYGRPAKKLTLYESAVLAGLLKAPARYSPGHNPQLSDQRARCVLNSMAEAGFISFPAVTAALALASPPPDFLKGSTVRYFTDWVFENLPNWVEDLDQDVEIITTLDLNLQRLAEEKMRTVMAQQRWKAKQMALVTMTPQGAVRAMVGGVHYGNSQFNRVTQALRQPGSTFKFFVFLAALEKGMTPDTVIDDTPVVLGKWRPGNWLYKPKGEITLRQAFAQSVNSATIRLAVSTGLPSLLEVVERLGITSPMPKNMTISLGSGEVSLLELTGAFAVVPNSGFAVKPYGIIEVRNRRGDVLYQHTQGVQVQRLLTRETTQAMDHLLRAVVQEGTGRSAALSWPVGGKTGTSQAYRDAWFVGYCRSLVTGVWSGIDDGQSMVRVPGGSPSIALWKEFMAGAIERGTLSSRAPTPSAPSDVVEDSPDEIGKLLRVLEEDIPSQGQD